MPEGRPYNLGNTQADYASINATSEMSASSRSRGRSLDNPRAVSYESDSRYSYAPVDPPSAETPRAQVLASGVAMPWALHAQRLLAEDWGVAADVWSATSWTELRRDALAAEAHNLLHPDEEPRVPYVTSALSGAPGPVVAVSDWMRAVPDQIARWVPAPSYTSLGTDGYGFSDTRPAARRFFHVDAESIVLAVLWQLAKTGQVDASLPPAAISKYQLDLPVSESLG